MEGKIASYSVGERTETSTGPQSSMFTVVASAAQFDPSEATLTVPVMADEPKLPVVDS